MAEHWTIETNGSRSFRNAATTLGIYDAQLGQTPDILYIPYGGRIDGVESRAITIIDVRDMARTATLAPFKYLLIHTHAHTWGIPQCAPYGFVVFYPADKEFNLVAPYTGNPSKDYFPTVYDAIWDVRNNAVKRWDINAPFEYDYDTFIPFADGLRRWIPELSSGWQMAELVRLLADTPYAADAATMEQYADYEAYNVWRLSWRTGCHSMRQGPPQRWLHPWHHRPLTLGEICSLADVRIDLAEEQKSVNLPTLIDNISRDVPNNLAQWLLEQCCFCLMNAWNGNAIDNAVEFNLYDYRPMAYDVSRFPVEAAKQFHNFDYKKWGL